MAERQRPKKVRRNISIDPELDAKLNEETNASGLINTLLHAYYAYGDAQAAIEYVENYDGGQ